MAPERCRGVHHDRSTHRCGNPGKRFKPFQAIFDTVLDKLLELRSRSGVEELSAFCPLLSAEQSVACQVKLNDRHLPGSVGRQDVAPCAKNDERDVQLPDWLQKGEKRLFATRARKQPHRPSDPESGMPGERLIQPEFNIRDRFKSGAV